MWCICDGSCLKNPGPGGWAFAILKEKTAQIYYGANTQTTNNQMELTAAIKALETFTDIALVYTDSKYLVDGITVWIKNWKSRGWQTKAKTPVANIDLWKKIDSLAGAKQDIKFTWIPGHARHADFTDPEERLRIWLQNKVDFFARKAAESLLDGMDEILLDAILLN